MRSCDTFVDPRYLLQDSLLWIQALGCYSYSNLRSNLASLLTIEDARVPELLDLT